MSAKGQSQIIQFMMFFMIGLAMFLTIGGVFRGRLDFFSSDISEENRKLVATYFSSLAIQSIVSCKECDDVNITTKISNTTAGSFTQVLLAGPNIVTSTQPGGASTYTTSAHNILSVLTAASGSAISAKPIILSYSNNQKVLELLQ